MKNTKRFVSWIALISFLAIYAFVFGVSVDVVLRTVEQGTFKTILFDSLAIVGALIFLWVNKVICKNHPRFYLFWSFMFNSRRVIKIEDTEDNEEFVVFSVEEKFLYVSGGDGTEKLLGARKYFPNIEDGDVLGRSGLNLHHSGAGKETLSVAI